MKTSIRSFLLINLLIGELVTILLAISIILFWGYRDAQQDMDSRLLETAFSVQNFFSQPDNLKWLPDLQRELEQCSALFSFSSKDYSEQYASSRVFHFHVADAHGNTLLDSDEVVPEPLLDADLGFSSIHLNKDIWRAFVTIDPITQIKIVMFQKKDNEHILPGRIAQEITLVMLISYPILALFIWLTLNRGLKWLHIISEQIQHQTPENFSYIDCTDIPVEIKPIAEEWNKLFHRLQLAFDREKRFAGDAAHELKTPLAALKTHTQLALNAKTEQELTNALNKIVAGVNRSAHVVQQLLTLNRINQGLISETPHSVNINQQAKEIIAELLPFALEKNIDIELIASETPTFIQGYDTAIAILIRNLVDNAIRYCPEDSLIQVTIETSPDQKHAVLKVIDNGPGIPKELRKRVFERFFRVLGNKSPGSGLGLGIVQQVVELHKAYIVLETPATGVGLQVSVTFLKSDA